MNLDFTSTPLKYVVALCLVLVFVGCFFNIVYDANAYVCVYYGMRLRYNLYNMLLVFVILMFNHQSTSPYY